MRRISGVVCALCVIACGGGEDKAKGDAFITAYAEVVRKVDKVCTQKRKLLMESAGSPSAGAAEAAVALVMGRAVTDYTLPEAPSSIASCRADAIKALDALRTALAPMVKKAAEPEGAEPAPVRSAVLRELWTQARSATGGAIRDLKLSWDRCKEEASKAGLSTVPLTLPPFMMGC